MYSNVSSMWCALFGPPQATLSLSLSPPFSEENVSHPVTECLSGSKQISEVFEAEFMFAE
jgi:hypothetical protein